MTTHFVQLGGGLVIETEDLRLWPEGKRLSREAGKKALADEARRTLRKLLRPGDTVWTSCDHVSSSGMTRHIALYVVTRHDGKPDIRNISGYVANLTGWRKTDNGRIVVGGAGMDMGFHAVYTLGAMLWPDGTRKPHGTRNGEPDSDGGYALKQRWL